MLSSSLHPQTSSATASIWALIDPRKKAGLSSRSSSDPFFKLTQGEIDDYAVEALSMYQKVLTNISAASQFVQALSNAAKLGKGKYVDDDFAPNIQSLVGDNLVNRSTWKAYSWLRPEHFMDSSRPVELFSGKIEPTDILQGHLGDCYFLSTVASIAEHPERIARIFNIDFPNKSKEEVLDLCRRFGCYGVRIYDMGIPTEVILDDFLPCISRSQGPAFTNSSQHEIRVLLLEKAWAKINFSYDNIEAGLTRE